MPFFGQVWVWSLAGFLVGALLCWLLIANPARKRVAVLERRLADDRRADPAPVTEQAPLPTRERTALVPGFADQRDEYTSADHDRRDRDDFDRDDFDRRDDRDDRDDYDRDAYDRNDRDDDRDEYDRDAHDPLDRHADQDDDRRPGDLFAPAEAAETTQYIPTAREDHDRAEDHERGDLAHFGDLSEAADDDRAERDHDALADDLAEDADRERWFPGRDGAEHADALPEPSRGFDDERADDDRIDLVDDGDGDDHGTIFTQHTDRIPAALIRSLDESRTDDEPEDDHAEDDHAEDNRAEDNERAGDLDGPDDLDGRDGLDRVDDRVDEDLDEVLPADSRHRMPAEPTAFTPRPGADTAAETSIVPRITDEDQDEPEAAAATTFVPRVTDEPDAFDDQRDPFAEPHADRHRPADAFTGSDAFDEPHREPADRHRADAFAEPDPYGDQRSADPFADQRREPEPVAEHREPEPVAAEPEVPAGFTSAFPPAPAGPQRPGGPLPKRVPAKPRTRVPFGITTPPGGPVPLPERPVAPSSPPVPFGVETTSNGGRERSLFEPIVPVDEAPAAPKPEPVAAAAAPQQRRRGARTLQQTAGGVDPFVPPGPFGPGSAMPLPGGRPPSGEYTIKASVTALRYCSPESPKFDRTVAEVWFRSVDDAERVGFRPLP